MFKKKGVLFLREVDGEPKWFKDAGGDEDYKYEGEIKGKKPNGKGTLIFADGDVYEGEFKEGEFNGQGTLTFSDGDGYVGEFKDGAYHGHGTYTDSDGEIYEGEWREGEQYFDDDDELEDEDDAEPISQDEGEITLVGTLE